jgi:alkanesulfonate monooxygenase SsuD/methylene tetrahydromethanopterin reductase-like flavin-dependent oxidoreductase (luciferase family)
MHIAVWDSVKPRPGISHVQLYRDHLAEVTVAEECGFQHYWFLEHHQTPTCPLPSPNLFIAAAAQHSSRIRLGTMVNVLPFRNPVLLAEELAMLDTLTNGRLDVGIGRGLKPTEFQTLGVPMNESREMFAEALEIMLGVWREERFAYRGQYFFVDKQSPLSPPLVQRPHPPLYMSAHSQESLTWAAEHDVPFGQIDARIPDCQRDQAYYREVQAASGFAPVPRLFLTREVFVDESDERARREAFPHLRIYWDLWGRYTQFALDGRMPESYDVWRKRAPELHAMSYEELIEQNMVLVGNPERVAEQILEHERQLDPAILVCVFHLGHLSHEQVVHSMRLFASEVLPRVQAARAVSRA